MKEPSIYDLIKKHYEQIELFYYQNQREIHRPKTRLIDVILWSCGYLIIIVVCVILGNIIKQPLFCKIPVLIVVCLIISEFSLRFIGIKIVECYQHYAKESTRRKCLCVPSCSEYAIICLKKYELIYALLKIRKRIFVTCKGSDYIIDNP